MLMMDRPSSVLCEDVLIHLYTCRAHDTANCRKQLCINLDLKPMLAQEQRKLQILEGAHKKWLSLDTTEEERQALTAVLLEIDGLSI